MVEQIPQNRAVLVAAGGTDGFVEVADNSGFYPGANAFLRSAVPGGQLCLIVTRRGTQFVGLRFIPEGKDDPKMLGKGGTIPWPSFGLSSCAAYPAGSVLSQDAQLCELVQPIGNPLVWANK